LDYFWMKRTDTSIRTFRQATSLAGGGGFPDIAGPPEFSIDKDKHSP